MNVQGNQRAGENRYFRWSGIMFALFCVLRFLLIILRDIFIVYAGIRVFSALSLIMTLALIVSGVCFIFFLAKWGITVSKRKKEELMTAVRNDEGPDLKIKGELNPLKIRENLATEARPWTSDPRISNALGGILKTMDDMDGYQAKLKVLLDRNGAEALRDTEEVLDKVEQHICRNVRKLINIMTVMDSRNANDRDVMVQNANNCIEDNNKLLLSTRNFMVAVSQFLNSQGEEGGTIEEVEEYKKILTDQILEGGIYK